MGEGAGPGHLRTCGGPSEHMRGNGGELDHLPLPCGSIGSGCNAGRERQLVLMGEFAWLCSMILHDKAF